MRRIVLIDPRGNRWETDVAQTRRERMRGLLSRDGLPEGRALLLERARSVHTFGMRFPITVAFLDDRLEVLSVRQARPGRLLLPRFRTRHVLECSAGTDIRPGDRLEVEWGPEAR